MKKQKIVCIIPARLASARFPKKIIVPLHNKPLLQWTWEAAKKCPLFDDVTFAIDSTITATTIESFGGTYHLTSPTCTSGTSRLVELQQSKKITADIWINWQADEPCIKPDMITTLLQSCSSDSADIWTLKKYIDDEQEVLSPHVVKVVCDNEGFAFYFSRSPIPYYAERNEQIYTKKYYKHLGIYAYTNNALKKIATMPPSPLEQAERLEQLRFLYYKLSIKVHETLHETIGIDTPQDLEKVEIYLQNLAN